MLVWLKTPQPYCEANLYLTVLGSSRIDAQTAVVHSLFFQTVLREAPSGRMLIVVQTIPKNSHIWDTLILVVKDLLSLFMLQTVFVLMSNSVRSVFTSLDSIEKRHAGAERKTMAPVLLVITAQVHCDTHILRHEALIGGQRTTELAAKVERWIGQHDINAAVKRNAVQLHQVHRVLERNVIYIILDQRRFQRENISRRSNGHIRFQAKADNCRYHKTFVFDDRDIRNWQLDDYTARSHLAALLHLTAVYREAQFLMI